MKTKIYLRIAQKKNGIIVKANAKPNYESLDNGSSYSRKYYPTVMVALELDIPDKEFSASRIQLEAKKAQTTPAVEIKQVKT